jgi:peptidoglycan hydrolase-like protein with peptidoglycan-binding domain
MSDAGNQSQDVPLPVDFVALTAGQMIGRYEVLSVLGQGGFGITYRARDSQLGREVAIKEYLPAALAVRQDGTTVLPRSTAAASDFTWGRERFVAEGRTLASLQNAPAIVRVFDFLEANGTAYIVMQLLHGDTLENRLRRSGPLKPEEIDRILWPLLDGLEQVHNAGFLHRDIKPANILLDQAGNPTLIDFGASRAAMAGRSTALTAIFTPGYAAAEQMTSAKQGPWTDIYGLSATLYHAITGHVPPSAFDRMLDDAYEPLGKKPLPGFGRGLLAGLDAGLASRATDRPQSIAGWRPILRQGAAPDADATLALARLPQPAAPTVAPPAAPEPARKRGVGLWIGAIAAALILLAGGYYALVDERRAPQAAAVDKAAQDGQLAAEAQRLKDREELARLRAEAAAREKAEQEANQRRQIEDETRRKVEAEMAARQREQEEAHQKTEAEAAAKRKADEDDRKAAEAAETALRLSVPDRQRVQVALAALGFPTGSTDGTFGTRTREVIANWQKSRGDRPTGYLNGTQNQALLREAAPAVARFDEEQKKQEEARRKADEDKAKAEAQARAAPPAAAPAQAPPLPQVAAAVPGTPPKPGPDGLWQGTYRCTPSRHGGNFTINLQINVAGGTGTWVRPGSGPGTIGNQSLTIRISGSQVAVARVFSPQNQVGVFSTGTMTARYEGTTITGSGPEHDSGGRSCDLSLTKVR